MSRLGEPIYRHNPAFLTPLEGSGQFVARHAELDLVLQALYDSEGGAARHAMVIGPRGIGKTTLVLRALIEIETREDLSERWFPVALAEESYGIATPGQFWLEVLFHVGRKVHEDRWRNVHSELSREGSDASLRERALGQLLDFADRQGRRLVVVVENLQQLLGEQLSQEDAWVLRHTLLNEPRILLLGTATTRFAALDAPAQALYGLFNVLQLAPLDDEGCSRLWTRLSGRIPDEARIRAVQILTGGNPRLVAILASLSEGHSLADLQRDLEQLVDQHTEYFKGHLDALPAGERGVYVALAELWRPATSREVAQVARQDVNKTSAFLRRLVERGMVRITRTEGRNNWYVVAEGLYSIYYLLRRSGGSASRVEALVRFLVEFDGEERLVSRAREVAEEALSGDSGTFGSSALAYRTLLDSAPDLRRRMEALTPPEFLAKLREWEAARGDSGRRVAEALLGASLEAGRKLAGTPEAEALLRATVHRFPNSVAAWTRLGEVLQEAGGRLPEAADSFKRALALKDDHRPALEGLERCSGQLEQWADQALALVRLGRWKGALQALQRELAGQPFARVQETVEACVRLTAAGFGEQVLALFEAARNPLSFEPVATGIRISLGEEPTVAPELMEAGREVARKVQRVQSQRGVGVS